MKHGDWRALALALVLVLGAVGAWFATATPPVQGLDAAPTAFSAARAMADDRAVAAKPHPTGSAEAGLVRAYLQQRMAALGLNPRIQAGSAVEIPRWFHGRAAAGAHVENLIGVLPGRDPSLPAILLMAHTDSVPGSPGAADDAAGVSAILEIVRALKAGPQPRRDVVVAFTDAEEAGLLGARALFASGDPILKHIGEVVNLEARGGGGRVAMFQTGPDNGGHIALFRQAVANTNANSVTSEVYKSMPNDTDFTVSRAAGYPGFNFAFIGEEFDYHSPSSTPGNLDQGALQHMGDQALAITRALATTETLPRAGPDAAYSDILGRFVVAYPAGVGGLIVLGLSLVVALIAVVHGQRRETGKRPNWGAALFAAFGTLFVAIVVGAVLWVASRLLGFGDFIHDRTLLAQYPYLFTGVTLLTIGAALFLIGPVQRGRAWTVLIPAEPTRWSAWGGAFLALFVLALVVQLRFPPMAVLTAWPLAAAAIVMALVAFAAGGRWEEPVAVVGATVVGVAVAAHLGHYLDQVFTAVGLMAPELAALFVLLATPVLFPLLAGWGRGGAVTQLISLAIVLVGAGLLAWVGWRDPSSSRTPGVVQAFFVEDGVAGKAWRASGLDRMDPWSAGVVGKNPVRRPVEALNASLWLAPAEKADQPRPVFTSSRDGDQVVVKIAPQAGGRELRMALKTSAPVKAMTVEGRPADILSRPGQVAWLRWSAPGEGITLRFTPTTATGELDLQYAEIKDGWPTSQAPGPRPKDRMPWGLSDTTVVLDELKTRW